MIICKTFQFHAAHHLSKLPGDHPCSRVHGHSYKLEVLIDGEVDSETGMVMDFSDLKTQVEPVLACLDHHDLNEVMETPTAENIATWIFRELLTAGLPMAAIRLWETDSSYVQFAYTDHLQQSGNSDDDS